MTASLRARLSSGQILVMPGVFDALSAHIAVRAGFEGVFLSGSALAYAQLGRPDIGLVSVTEVADALARIRDRIDAPILVDADSGFGNALNVARTVKVFERAGASAIQIEDQINHKRPGDLQARPLVPIAEMVGKIKAALDARADAATLISARSDAPFTETFEQSLARAQAYVEAGADIVFVEGLSDLAQMRQLTAAFKGKAPLLHNVIDGGKSPVTTAAELDALGYRVVLFPGAAVQSAASAMEKAMAALKADGHTASFRAAMHDAKSLNALIGTPDVISAAKAYDADKYSR
jgi:2-methylisocitrate lyase-like PEP mutase family enzyme